MDYKSSTDSEKTNGKHNSESSEQEFGQVINDNDCQMLSKNIESPIKSQEQYSQSLFSEETPEIDVLMTKKAISSETSSKSSDVDQIVQPVELIILETESESTTDKNSVIMVPDSDEADKSDQQRSIRRKSTDLSPIPCKRTCTEESRQSESTTNIDTTSTVQSPIRNIPVRSSPRNSPQRNLLNLYKPARRLKKSASFDTDLRSKNISSLNDTPASSHTLDTSPSTSSNKKISKLTLRRKRAVSVDVKQTNDSIMREISSQDELAGYISSKMLPREIEKIASGRKNPIESIIEETQKETPSPQRDESQNIPNDSQNIVLFLSPSFDSQNLLSNDVMDNEPLLSQDYENSDNDSSNVILLSQCNPANKGISNGDTHPSTDQESTVSVNLDSPFYLQAPENVVLKSKPYLSNGYSSSTPENNLQEVILKKSFPLSDSETDNTPPFSNFNKNTNEDSKMSISGKSNSSGITTNSSISPLNNGHSNGSNIDSSNPSVPMFHVQMYGDENDDFLSMFIVKTTTDMGLQTLREYQRISKRLSFDPYTGDVSKSTSPSSVTSGGLYQLPMHPRSSFMSTGSSSSTSSSRTSDGVFIIPQRPKRNLSFHTPTTVKGWHALKQSVSDVISKLADLDPAEESTPSPINGDCKREQTPPPNMDKTSPNENNVKTNDCHRTTPKSSKKKIQTRTKRVLSSRNKKAELTVTNEESLEQIEDISFDNNQHEQFESPSRLKSNGESSNTSKSTPRGKKFKNGSAALNLSTVTDSLQSVINVEQTYPKGTLVLAKWRDKKYYSGKVIGAIDNNKYEIEFYDGQVKTLLDDFIIFGDMTQLPLKGQSVYTKVDDVTYEPSLVLSLEKTETGEVLYKCTTDRDSMVSVSASDIYLTEDQAKSFHDSNPPRSPHLTPSTPRRRINRDLDLNNIIHEPRSARLRDKGTFKGSLHSPASPKPGPSSMRKGGGMPQRRLESESSEEGDSRASSTVPEDVEGVQPETQSTPRKTRGIKVNYITKSLISIKGSSKQKTGKDSKVKFETEEEITETLGPMPAEGSTFFSGLHFLLTCTDIPVLREINLKQNISDSDSYAESSEREEEIILARIPFTKERLAKQLEMAGGTVYSRFEDIPKSKYNSCRLIVPRPCLTGMYIMCLASNIKALSHLWVIESCKTKKLADYCSFALPTGYSIERQRMISLEERTTCKPFKDKLILVCGENENFTRFWDRVCSLAGANTKIITEDDMDLRYSIAIVTEYSCPTKIINKAEYEKISLVSPTWVVQCLIEGKLLSVNGNVRYMFNYIDT